MQPYANRSGNSGVEAFQIGPDFIIVKFRGSHTYLYEYDTTGAELVDAMKELAVEGRGLCTFISKNVQERYAEKW